MCLTRIVKKVEFWQPSLEVLPFWNPHILANYIFLLYLLTLKISCGQLKRLKSLNFGGPRLGNPILKRLILLGLV